MAKKISEGGNPLSVERTIINVKGVETAIWDRARACARRADESMGSWLSRAIRQLAEREESGPRELPAEPGQVGIAAETISANPVSMAMSPADLSALLHAVAAVATATGVAPSRADTKRALGLADTMVRQAAHLPPRPVRIGKSAGSAGQEVKKIGQSPALALLPHGPIVDGASGRDRGDRAKVRKPTG